MTTNQDTAREGGEGIFGCAVDPDEAGVILISAPWEATTSYGRGTARGPEAILAASLQVDLFDLELEDLGWGEPHRAGIVMTGPSAELLERSARASEDALAVIAAHDAGGEVPEAALERVGEATAWLDEHLAAAVRRHAARALVGVVGGDHSVAFPSIAAQGERHPGMGILHIDAHADLRVAYQGFVGSHASVMHRVLGLPSVGRIVSVGLRDLCVAEHETIRGSDGRVVAFFDADLARRKSEGETWSSIARQIVESLPAEVYLSLDVDGLDPALCPHTGTPVPGGLSFHELMGLFDALRRSGRRVVGFDLCEVAPGPEGDEWDANVGARLLYKMIGTALATR